MNMLFVYDGKIITSPLKGTVLDGITRRSTLALAEELGYQIEERALSVDEILEGTKNGRLSEAFGTGTAVVISPVGSFCYKDHCVQVGDGTPGKLTMELYNKLTGVQYGKEEDKYGWVTIL
jgi:branched-chain amino acid aminotransferase